MGVKDKDKGVAIRRCFSHVASADRARGADAVFDDELLTQRFGQFAAIKRAIGSTEPPGGNGETKVTAFAGQDCAKVAGASVTPSTASRRDKPRNRFAIIEGIPS